MLGCGSKRLAIGTIRYGENANTREEKNMNDGMNPPGVNGSFFPLEWNDLVVDAQQKYEARECPRCRKVTKKSYRARPDTIHGGQIICQVCEFNFAWTGKPKTGVRRGKNTLNLAQKYELHYCELCLRYKAELPEGQTIHGHHVIEVQDGGKDERANIWGLCTQCHALVSHVRRYIGKNKLGQKRDGAA